MAALVPMAVREFHRMRFLGKAAICGGIFVGMNYAVMRNTFNDYIGECQEVVRKNIGRLGP